MTNELRQVTHMMLQWTQNVSLMQQSQVTSSSTHCSHAAAKDVIPSFDPKDRTQTMENWLQFIDELARVYGWGDQNTTINATAKLREERKQAQEFRRDLRNQQPCILEDENDCQD
ncbi:hypothetical protein CBL_21385, partial [Carabus blaptoides fortunei]